jgi:hypothetical protein
MALPVLVSSLDSRRIPSPGIRSPVGLTVARAMPGVCGWLADGQSYSSDPRGHAEADTRPLGRDRRLVSSSWGRHVTVRGLPSGTKRFCVGNVPGELSGGNRIVPGASHGA